MLCPRRTLEAISVLHEDDRLWNSVPLVAQHPNAPVRKFRVIRANPFKRRLRNVVDESKAMSVGQSKQASLLDESA